MKWPSSKADVLPHLNLVRSCKTLSLNCWGNSDNALWLWTVFVVMLEGISPETVVEIKYLAK